MRPHGRRRSQRPQLRSTSYLLQGAEPYRGISIHAGSGLDDGSQGRGVGGWVPRPVRGGHSGPVVDMCWAADGACLLTVSADQTARIFTRCRGSWCEVARPEVRVHPTQASLPASRVDDFVVSVTSAELRRGGLDPQLGPPSEWCLGRLQHIPTVRM